MTISLGTSAITCSLFNHVSANNNSWYWRVNSAPKTLTVLPWSGSGITNHQMMYFRLRPQTGLFFSAELSWIPEYYVTPDTQIWAIKHVFIFPHMFHLVCVCAFPWWKHFYSIKNKPDNKIASQFSLILLWCGLSCFETWNSLSGYMLFTLSYSIICFGYDQM